MGSVEGPLAGVPVSRCGPSLGVPPGGGICEESRTMSVSGRWRQLWSAVIKVLNAVRPTQPYDPPCGLLPPGSPP